jgi:branched-chain amino acid transport system permease protein
VTAVFGIPMTVLLGQLMLGLVNGSFYALLSLGLAVIFGLMGVVNFAHGAFYALGAYAALFGLQQLGVDYWAALLLAPVAVGLLGVVSERLLLRRLYGLDPLYGLLMTFGLALVIEGLLHQAFGASGFLASSLGRSRFAGAASTSR